MNQEHRVEQVINKLEKLEKSHKDNNNSATKNKNKQDNKIPIQIVVGGICLVMVILGVAMMVLIRKKQKTKL